MRMTTKRAFDRLAGSLAAFAADPGSQSTEGVARQLSRLSAEEVSEVTGAATDLAAACCVANAAAMVVSNQLQPSPEAVELALSAVRVYASAVDALDEATLT